MQPVASFDMRRLARGAGFVLVGGLGSLALTFPLFGALGYIGSLFLPLVLAWFAGGLVFAVTAPGRLARTYLLANLGMLAGTFSVLAVVWIRSVISGDQPSPTIAAPLYLSLVVAGLLLGVAVGASRPHAKA